MKVGSFRLGSGKNCKSENFWNFKSESLSKKETNLSMQIFLKPYFIRLIMGILTLDWRVNTW